LLPKVAVVCVLLAGAAACSTPPDRVTVTELQPQRVRLLGEHGDPLVILIAVHWTKPGYCSGQFTVKATETATQVRVDNVISREHSQGFCAGLGTAEETAWADVRLAAPLGDRPVVRISDGARLPVATWGPAPLPSTSPNVTLSATV
jgi:hypothetical protein